METRNGYYDVYPQTASGASLKIAPRHNPMEETYRVALNNLEDCYSKQRDLLYRYSGGDPYYMNRDLYELESWFHNQRARLERHMKESAYNLQCYYYNMVNQGYGYGLRRQRQRWEWPVTDYSTQPIPYQYTYTYLNSTTGETTPVMPTETKKYIILDSSDDTGTYFADATDSVKFPPFATLADAEKEAQELARKNPTEEFTIYSSVKKYKVAGTPLDTVVFV